MSDDTPTVSFPPSAGGSVPSQTAATSILATGPGAFQRPPTRQRPQRPPSRGPIVLFVILAVLVVAAIVVLIVILDGRLSAQSAAPPSASPSVSSSAVSAPAPTKTTAPPPPPAAAGAFTSFTVPQSQGGCGRHGTPTVMVSWATSNAKTVWIQTGTVDAAAGGGTELPLTGNQSDVPDSFTLDCSQRFNTYSITLVGDNGGHVSKTWTIRVGGHRF